MKKSKFTEQQIAFALQQAEGGTGGRIGLCSEPDCSAGALPSNPARRWRTRGVSLGIGA